MEFFKRIVALLFVLNCLFVEAQSINHREGYNSTYENLPFDVNSVISQVSQQRTLENPEGEFLIDTNVVYVSATYYQKSPAVAFDGTNYLVVWQDGRGVSYDIYCARINQSGVVLDSAGIVISNNLNDECFPSVAFDGTNYLVVWQNGYGGSTFGIYGARVSQSGIVLDSIKIPISPIPWDQQYPAVAFDGTNYLVVWQDKRYFWTYDIYGARVSPSGRVLDLDGIAISTAGNHQEFPSVAFDGTNYLVVWQDQRDYYYRFSIYCARVSPDGIVLDTVGLVVALSANWLMYPSLAFGATNYLVVWQNIRFSSYYYYSIVNGVRVNKSGEVIDTAFILISTDSVALYSHSSPAVAFDGTNYLVVWQNATNYADICGVMLSQSGTILDSLRIAITTQTAHQDGPTITFGDTNYLVLWQDYRNGLSDIYGARVNTSGNILDIDGIATSFSAYEQKYPSVTSDGTNYLAVWQDERNTSVSASDIYGARVSQSGVILDFPNIAISTREDHQTSPSVACGMTNYLVTWEDFQGGGRSIYCARVGLDGVVLDTSGIAIASGNGWNQNPAAAFDGTNYFVVWQDYLNGSYDIYGARMAPSGTILDTSGIIISSARDHQENPSVAFDGTNYFIVWQDRRNDALDIYGARVSAESGTVLDPDGIAVSTVEGHQKSPAVAFNGINYLIVWEDERNNPWFSTDIYGARVSPPGTILDSSGIAISISGNHAFSPAVTHSGSNYIVVWRDERTGVSYDIYGAKVSSTGEVIDSFVVSAQPGYQTSPALAHGQENQILVTYSGFVDSINGRPANTMRIWGKFYPFTGIEEEAGFEIQDKRYGLTVYPNPFRHFTNIRYEICDIGYEIQNSPLRIYDATGRLVKEFNQLTNHQSSVNQIVWDATDNLDRKLPTGIYFCRLATDKIDITEKIILLR